MEHTPHLDLPTGVTILDGGMGQELMRRGITHTGALWSAYALISEPQMVRQIHEDNIRAGADVITTDTYAVVRSRLALEGVEEHYEKLNRLAGGLANQARDNCGKDVLIAGSLPPLRGSYRPDLVGPYEEIVPLYEEQARLLEPYVDLFLCETMSSSAESRAAADAAGSTGKPVWVAWTLLDGGSDRLRSGETVDQALETMDQSPVSAYLFNCCPPESVEAALPRLARLSPCPVGAYANAFVQVPQTWIYTGDEPDLDARRDLDPEAYAAHAQKWVQAGARIVGGCCEVGPEHIAELSRVLKKR
jgi:S-methylmethionine-dependent homocysteine/selenocysteine methylase